ncbi:aminopeptidase N [Streptomyces botrytidirepellens]|uniref:Aminopeptidase N n=1 Tax=Streptomyces botrytidirepellens TaxID=2486417 RepID=A0A3M8SK87_9ACTN|nr:aminopeptidase N [Streptomyces botrytidirepellens]RNF79986.1 aminopeptidase N [Streptomyces botrytidirepellens]
MSVLTREEAQIRARLIEVHRYTIDLDLTRGDEHFGSTTTIRFSAREDGADTFVELSPAALHRAVLDGHDLALDPAQVIADGRIPLTGLAEGEHELRVETDMTYSHTGEGMHRFTDPADGETYLYTMCCMSDANDVFTAFDQPDLKAVFDVRVTAPPRWTVLGNGIATRDGDPADGRWRLAPTPPISTYLVALAAGPYHSVHTEHAGLPFGLHVRRSLAPHLEADADELFDITRRCFDRYHEIFDEPYPFDSYDQAFVPEFNSGAMENPGLVTFRDEFVFRSAVTDAERQTRAMVIAHEMAHMWFGDLVTMRWWDDIWLNESFAEYMGFQILTEATRHTDTWADFGIRRKTWGYDADQRPSTHPVAPAPELVPDTAAARLNFDGISYAKGASALRQLVTWLGEKDFLAGINEHFTRHRFGNATLADFLDSLARSTDRDVHAWADAWLRTTGVDTLTPAITTDGGHWHLEIHHEGAPEPARRRPHRIAIGLYDHEPAAPHQLVLRKRIEAELNGADPAARLSFTGPRPDLLLLNDGDLTYTKIRLDPGSWKAAVRSLSGLPDTVSRATLWNAARDMVRDGDLPAADYLDAARTHLPHETDIAIVQGVLAFARTQIADRYVPADQRPAALNTLAATCRDLLRRTEDGSGPGLRLSAVRTYIASATAPAELTDWLDGDTVPGGPALDPELRWQILGRLAVLGAAGPADIDAELARDSSATGQEGAARCRAALPDPEAKRAAWDALFGETDAHPELSNYLVTATATGFWQPEHHDLLTEYVPRFFTDAAATAARRGPAIADALARSGFPTTVDATTLRLGEECLSAPDLLPALRRRLEDQLDDLRRALRVRNEPAD